MMRQLTLTGQARDVHAPARCPKCGRAARFLVRGFGAHEGWNVYEHATSTDCRIVTFRERVRA